MRQGAALFATVLVLMLARTAADAAWRIDAEGGAFVPVDSVSFDAGGDSFDVDVATGGSFAVGGGYGLGDWVDLTAHAQGNFSGVEALLNSLDVYSVTAGARVYLLPPQRFRLWLVGEIGWYHADADIDAIFSTVSQSDDSFGLNVGGGFDVAINPRVSLGLDVRYHNAFEALNGLQFVTTMFNVGIHFGR